MGSAAATSLLLALLAAALLRATATDLSRREIDNSLNAAIALAAPLYWWAGGLALWPDAAAQLALGLGVFALFALAFALGMMGGGDVKLIAALALWFPWQLVMQMIVVLSLAGGVLTLVCLVHHRWRGRAAPTSDATLAADDHSGPAAVEVPYGVAIAFAGLWVIATLNLNHFA